MKSVFNILQRQSYIKADDNTMLNENYIKSIKQVNDCYHICINSNGCKNSDTYKICKLNIESYTKINNIFK